MTLLALEGDRGRRRRYERSVAKERKQWIGIHERGNEKKRKRAI